MEQQLMTDILQWDVKSWSKALLFWEKSVEFKPGMKALELGGRQGGLSLWLALKDVEIVCSDYSEDVEATAIPLHQKHKVTSKISYENIDATNIPYENHFDFIVFKSIIGGIGYGNNYDRQQQVFGEIYKALKPGGKLLFAENLVASPLHRSLRRRYVKWGDSWRYLALSEIDEMLEKFKQSEVRSTGFSATFGRSEKQRNMLSRADKLLNAFTPKSWKYIAYGIAEK